MTKQRVVTVSAYFHNIAEAAIWAKSQTNLKKHGSRVFLLPYKKAFVIVRTVTDRDYKEPRMLCNSHVCKNIKTENKPFMQWVKTLTAKDCPWVQTINPQSAWEIK